MSADPRALDRAMPFVLIGAGGFAGAALRHALALSLPSSLPWGTLAANVAANYGIGLVAVGSLAGAALS